ncbi:unnamed protein product, partial [Mesorhabditis spiculigera]
MSLAKKYTQQTRNENGGIGFGMVQLGPHFDKRLVQIFAPERPLVLAMTAGDYMLLFFFFVVAVAAQENIPVDGDKTLQFVQVIWRHGDRSPTTTCGTDQFQEETWTFGGGGWGQLSPIGMQQHVSLGNKLRQRYIDTKFLAENYRADEVYFRSTDVNRTLLSAVSNTIGMYGQGSAVKGVWGNIPDFGPDVNYTWPAFFIPIPIHTTYNPTDYYGNPDADCPRQTALWQTAQTTPEISKLLNDDNTKKVFSILAEKCGKQYKLEDLWEVIDAFFIERVYNLSNPAWMDDDLFNNVFNLNNIAQDFVNGIGVSALNGVDISTETRRIRSGAMFNLFNDQIKQKRDCVTSNGTKCSHWLKNLKYFVYSAHDTTVYAYLTALNSEKLVIKDGGYPHYSAAVLTEYWRDTAGKDYVKFVYHNGYQDGFTVFTDQVPICNGSHIYCPLENYSQHAADLSFAKWGSPEKMCADVSFASSASSTPKVEATTTKAAQKALGIVGLVLTLISMVRLL